MITEKNPMSPVRLGSDKAGHITLDKLAIPETVKVKLLGKTIIPSAFDRYGHPYFNEEQWTNYLVKQRLKNMYENVSDDQLLELEVSYQERIFTAPRSSFDTVEGITCSLGSLSDLNKMLDNRRIFGRIYDDLNEFVLFGCFYLDQFGQVMTVKRSEWGKLVTEKEVENFYTFKKNNSRFTFTFDDYAIPPADSVCPLCGSKFTIDDLRYAPCVCVDGKFYHDDCWRNYRKSKEIYNFSFMIMDRIYDSKDYKFDLLPNGYCHEDCCSHIPWFLFHTIDGDIIMGWRKRVISIEWQENYKSFNMEELFSEEDVTKWEEGGKRGIHAWGDAKAIEYLKKVREAVNPDYRGW